VTGTAFTALPTGFARATDTAWTGENGETHGRELAEMTGATEPEKLVLNSTYSEEVQQALDALSDEFRATILLADVEEMSYEEIAVTMQIPVGTVRSRIHRGRTQMRKTLESLGWRG
jgi:RNA polymerase sigma factor (sigma-70 family)